MTFSENIFREKFANKIEVALSWDGIAQHDKSDVEKFLIAEEFNLAVLLLAKNCEEKSGYLGLSSIIDPTTHNYFVYAFRKNEKKAEVVRVEKIRVENETIVYELNTPHDPITGSVLYFMDTDKKCYLVGIISHSEENNHYAFYLSENRVNKIKDLILQLKQ